MRCWPGWAPLQDFEGAAMSGQLFEGLVIAAAVVAIFYILWRNNQGRHGPGPGDGGSAGPGS